MLLKLDTSEKFVSIYHNYYMLDMKVNASFLQKELKRETAYQLKLKFTYGILYKRSQHWVTADLEKIVVV